MKGKQGERDGKIKEMMKEGIVEERNGKIDRKIKKDR